MVLLVLLGLSFGDWVVRIMGAAILLIYAVSCARLWSAHRKVEHDMGVQLESAKRRRRAQQP